MRGCYFPSAVFLVAAVVCGGQAADRGGELVEAARRGDREQVTQLLAEGVDIDARGRFGITALWQAVSKEHRDLARLLVEQGADVNLPDDVWHVTPLMLARDAELVEMLVRRGARGAEGKLNEAALTGDAAVVRAILAARPLEPRLLARAKAHAEIGDHGEIVELLEKATDKPLPDLPRITADQLERYRGRYTSERLNDLEVVVREAGLLIKQGSWPEFALVPVDERTFAFGASRFRFEVEEGQVVRLVREDLFSSRHYTPRRDDELPAVEAAAAAARVDDPRVIAGDRWPSFRGLEARGLAAKQNLPLEWDVDAASHVRWRTPIPGLGNSCPIVWDDKVFVTTAVSEAGRDDLRIGLYGDIAAVDDASQHAWQLLCLDKHSGQVLWQRTAHSGVPEVKRHLKSSQANSTPATDGRHVVALFNSGGLYCHDFEGQLLWSRQLGRLDSGAFHDPDAQWGFGSSPIIYRDTVIVQCDLQQDSFIAAYDLATGSEIWRQARDEIPSWGTPTVVESPRGPLLLTNATRFARGYDALSGRERWRLAGNAAITVPTPLVAYDLVFVSSGYRPIQPIFAVRLDAAGDISLPPDEESNAGIAWSKPRGGPYLPTPLVYGGYLYTCGNNGVLTCYEATTGRRVYRQRAARGDASSFTASPVAADGRIYLTAESGQVLVVRAGPKFELLAENALGEYCLATPAIAGGLFLARTQKHLVAIGAPASP